MSFNDFINTFVYGINIFLENFNNFLSMAVSNYIFLVLLGLTLFISFFWFCYELFHEVLLSHFSNSIDHEIDMYDNFDKFQHMKQRWYDNNMLYLYQLKFVNYEVFQNVKSLHLSKKLHDDFESLNNYMLDRNERIVNDNDITSLSTHTRLVLAQLEELNPEIRDKIRKLDDEITGYKEK